MWQKIKELIFVQESPAPSATLHMLPPEIVHKTVNDMDVIQAALDHYCELCDKGYKTRGARNSHKTLKHRKKDE